MVQHQIFKFAKVILRDSCASYGLASLFLGVVNALDRWGRTIGKCIGARPSALHSIRRLASFVMLSTSNIEEVSFMSRRGRL